MSHFDKAALMTLVLGLIAEFNMYLDLTNAEDRSSIICLGLKYILIQQII